MQLIKFIIIMIGLSSYLEYAQAQKKDLSSVEGIVIYDDTQQPVPPVMIFIPATLNNEKNIVDLLKEKLSDSNTRGFIIYFQSLSWILPDLEDTIKSLKYTIINYGGLNKQHKVSYGKFTFDKTIKGDSDNIEDKTVTRVPILLNEKKFNLLVSELPNAMGTPKLFEKVD